MNLRRGYRDIRALPMRQAGQYLLRKASKGWRARKAEREASKHVAAIENDLASALQSPQPVSLLNAKFEQLEGFPIPFVQIQQTAELICLAFPVWRERCIESADGVCAN